LLYNIYMRLTRGKKAAVGLLIVIFVLGAGLVSAMAVHAAVEDRSMGSVFCEYVFRVVLTRNDFRSEEGTLKLIEKARENNEDYKVPQIYKTVFNFDIQTVSGYEVCFFGEDSGTLIYYLHGGSFIYQPTPFHYIYAKKLAKELNAKVALPVYPKAPNYSYEYILDSVYCIYSELTGGAGYQNIVVMGDSAGATLTLTLGQYIAEHGGIMPNDLISICPVVDMTLTNPEIDKLQKYDPMLNAKDLKLQLNAYSGGNPTKEDYKLNPIYCDFSVMPEVTVFAGGYDILTPDIRKLKEKLDGEGISINYYEYPRMAHTFPLFPIPEADRALEQIKAVIYN
jgi:acetyl esterase/lipase